MFQLESHSINRTPWRPETGSLLRILHVGFLSSLLTTLERQPQCVLDFCVYPAACRNHRNPCKTDNVVLLRSLSPGTLRKFLATQLGGLPLTLTRLWA